MTKIFGIVVTFQSEGVLSACLERLREQVDHLIVVDNSSSDATREIASRYEAEVICNHENEGYGRANNRGIEAATHAAWCLIANPDILVQPGCVAQLTAAADRFPLAAILVPRLVEPDGRVFFRENSVLSSVPPETAKDAAPPVGEGVIAFASGACMLVRRDAFLSLGGFDEKIFLYYEDDDLSLRVRRAGLEIVFVESAVAHHLRGGSSTSVRGSVYWSRFHQSWSRAYVARKYGVPERNGETIVRNVLKLIAAVLMGNRERIERSAGSIAGTWAGLRQRPATSRIPK